MKPAAATSMLCLDGEGFSQAFPFHMVVDKQLQVIQTGATLARLLPQLRPGAALASHFTLLSHTGSFHFEQLCQHRSQLLILHSAELGLKLRGQCIPQDEYVFLLLSLWLDTPAQLTLFNLSVNDFALHDPVIDLLHVVQAHRTALDDSKSLSSSLEHKRRTLATANSILHAREKELVRVSGELNAIFELSPDGLASFDGSGVAGYANTAFLRMLGLDEPGQPTLVNEVDLDRWLQSLLEPGLPYTRIADMQEASSDLLELQRPRRAFLRRSVRLLVDGSGGINGRILYLRDISHEREVDAIKTEFLTTAAHELRTPLTSIFGYAELLLTREFTAERRQGLLEVIWRHSHQLIQLLNELLDLVRMESRAGMDFHITLQQLSPLVCSISDDFLPPDCGRPLHIASGPDLWIAVDGVKFRAALGNILSNALKYSPEGSPISISWQNRCLAGQEQIGVAVSDQGIGMNAEQVARACERFYRADPNGTIPGTGLGLSLVREIMKVLQGDVTLSSSPGKGTSVVLWLPVQTPVP